MARHESFLTYAGFRHFKMALAFLAVTTAGYAWYDPVGGRNGGTWLGYLYGALALGLIFWLMWLGVRKRRYTIQGAQLMGWLSAHVYLGATLPLLVPLHSGFQFGWNVHTLAYALLLVAVVSGVVGVLFYANVPRLISENRPGQKLESLFQQIADLDAECRQLAAGLPDAVARATGRAVSETRIGGGLLRQLSGTDPRCATAWALVAIQRELHRLDSTERGAALHVVEVLARKNRLLARVRRDLRYRTLLDLWLYFHVPVSFAMLAAVGVHVFVVFYCW